MEDHKKRRGDEPAHPVEVRLAERAKEFGCLCALSRLIDQRRITVAGILSKSIDLLPPGFAHPDIARARLTTDTGEFTAAGYERTPWCLEHDVVVDGRSIGSLSVCYLEERPTADEGPFRVEEVFLVEAFADRLGRLIERQRVAARLRSDRERLEALWSLASLPDLAPDDVADHVLQTMTRMTGSSLGFYATVADDGTATVTRVLSEQAMPSRSRGGDRSLPIGGAGLWAETIRRRKPTIVNDYQSEHPRDKELPAGHARVRNVLVVPLISKGRVSSLAVLANKASDFETDDAVQVTAFFASVQAILERKKVEQELRLKSEITGNMSEGVLVVSADERTIIYTNPGFDTMFGYDPGELIGTCASVLDYPSDGNNAASTARVTAAIDGQGAWCGEVVKRKKDGDALWCLANKSGMSLPGGDRVIVAVYSDLTDVRRARQALSEREWRLNSIIEATGVGTWEWNVQTGELTINEAWAGMLGYTLDELAPWTYDTWRRLTHPDDLRRATELLDRHFADELEDFEIDVRMRHKDRHWIWVHDRGRVITRTTDGSPLMMFGTHTDVTARMRIDEQLRDRNRFSEVILENSPIGFAVNTIDDGERVFVSRMFERVYGVEPDSINSVDDYFEQVYVDPVYREQMRDRIMADMASGDPSRMRWLDVPLRTRSGEDKVVDIINIPLIEQNLMISTVQDVTERYRALEALRESEDNFRSVVERASDGIAVVQDGVFVFANSAALAMTGYEREALLGVQFSQIVSPEDRALAIDRAARRLDGEDVPGTYELNLLRIDGGLITVEVSATVISYGGSVANLIVARDVTERRRAELALSHSHELMRYVIEHNRSAVAVHDKDLKYIYVSERYLDEYGVTDRDIIGKHHYDVFPDLPEKWRIAHQRALRGEILSEEDDSYERADGSVVWTRWECRPWYEADGSIGGIIVYTEVITDRKLAQERLVRYQERLRSLAAQLVASAEREQRRLGVELHDGLGQLLAAAKMESQIVSAEAPDGVSGNRLRRLVELLSESIREVRTLTAELAPTTLLEHGLQASLVWLRERYSQLYHLRCTLRMDDESKRLDTRTAMLVFRTVRECLNNVVRHSGVSDATVTVRTCDGWHVVRVSDRGAGFDTSAAEDSGPGGFGLFSLREECLARGGTLEVWSEPLKGTRVTARIPAVSGGDG